MKDGAQTRPQAGFITSSDKLVAAIELFLKSKAKRSHKNKRGQMATEVALKTKRSDAKKTAKLLKQSQSQIIAI